MAVEGAGGDFPIDGFALRQRPRAPRAHWEVQRSRAVARPAVRSEGAFTPYLRIPDDGYVKAARSHVLHKSVPLASRMNRVSLTPRRRSGTSRFPNRE